MNDQHPAENILPPKSNESEKVKLDTSYGTKKHGFAVFLIGCALFVAAFAVTAVWMSGVTPWFSKDESDVTAESTFAPTNGSVPTTDLSDHGTLTEPSKPQGAVSILGMDLSYSGLGDRYIHNETQFTPNVADLLARELWHNDCGEEPLVLILHTHTSESYLPQGTTYIEGSVGDATYSEDAAQNVLAVGETLCRALGEHGIPAIHCQIMHDTSGVGGAYARAAESIQQYLKQYPSIELVIDLHRDSVSTVEGAQVRSEGKYGDETVAQVMAVVGTDGNGSVFLEGWEGNLALGLQLRARLNANGNTVCRPVSLRNASYNQELAKRSILLEIGTAANSPEEAKRAAELVGDVLADLIQAR